MAPLRENNCEPCKTIILGLKGEATTVAGQYFAYEDKSYALSSCLCGEEGAEEIGFCLLVDAAAIVGDDNLRRGGESTDAYFTIALYAFNRVLNYVHKHLFQQYCIYVCGYSLGREIHFKCNVMLAA